MRVDEIRYYPDQQNYRLVNMHHCGKTYAYYNDGSLEIFEVYFNKANHSGNGHYYSRRYAISGAKKVHKVPQTHQEALDFLKQEFNKVDWDTLCTKTKETK